MKNVLLAALILIIIQPQCIIADIKSDATLHADKSEKSAEEAKVEAGKKAEILRDYSEEWYYVRLLDSDAVGWVRRNALSIPPDAQPEESVLSDAELEIYANNMNYDSETSNLVIADLWRQYVYIFEGGKGNWKAVYRMRISSGRNVSPTPTGEFTLRERGDWFYSSRLGSGGMYWVRFDGAYLFHSVAMDKDKNIIDQTIGRRASNGCIRLSVNDAKWFYKNVPDGSKVVII
ncbi:MAG: L,D-transpeptidase [Defluviitaleaceae bacterium]|nr:L,D-transpeptidase [Defluviitaleaceae bacterium]